MSIKKLKKRLRKQLLQEALRITSNSSKTKHLNGLVRLKGILQ